MRGQFVIDRLLCDKRSDLPHKRYPKPEYLLGTELWQRDGDRWVKYVYAELPLNKPERRYGWRLL